VEANLQQRAEQIRVGPLMTVAFQSPLTIGISKATACHLLERLEVWREGAAQSKSHVGSPGGPLAEQPGGLNGNALRCAEC
jgi:hypothetical protein